MQQTARERAARARQRDHACDRSATLGDDDRASSRLDFVQGRKALSLKFPRWHRLFAFFGAHGHDGTHMTMKRAHHL